MIVSTGWNNLIMFTMPTRGFNYNNQIVVYDLSNKDKPKWYIWDINANWMGTISPPNRIVLYTSGMVSISINL